MTFEITDEQKKELIPLIEIKLSDLELRIEDLEHEWNTAELKYMECKAALDTQVSKKECLADLLSKLKSPDITEPPPEPEATAGKVTKSNGYFTNVSEIPFMNNGCGKYILSEPDYKKYYNVHSKGKLPIDYAFLDASSPDDFGIISEVALDIHEFPVLLVAKYLEIKYIIDMRDLLKVPCPILPSFWKDSKLSGSRKTLIAAMRWLLVDLKIDEDYKYLIKVGTATKPNGKIADDFLEA